MPRGDLPRTIAYSDTGTPELPPERFENAGEVRSLCNMMIRADRTRAAMRTRVDALVDGFPTYPKSVTASKGFGWLPRVNYLEADGLIRTMQTPLFDLVTEVNHCIDIDLDVKSESQEERDEWEYEIEDAFTWLLHKRWRTSFNFHLPLSQREMLVHGMGAHVWPNNRWIPRTPRSGQILFPESASLDFEEQGDYFMLRDFVPGVKVYEFIRNEKTAAKLGWYPDNVWRGLANAQRQNIRTYRENVEEIQRRYKRADLGYWSTTQVGLWFNWVFVKEYEGGISLYCVDENLDVGRKDGGYYYKKRYQFDEWPLTLFPCDLGQGDIHSIRGYGWRTKDFYELSNRVNNAMAVQVLISALPQVKQTQPSLDPDKLRLARLGALSIIPYGLDPAVQQFPPLNNSGLALQRHLKDTLESNNAASPSAGTPEPKDRETKYSFMVRSHDQARVSNGMQSLYESHLQTFYERLYRRLINTPKGDLPFQKMAEEFRERCRRNGVPDAALKEIAIGEIREVTSTGAGSAAVRLQAIQLLLQSPVYANAPESKKITIERDLVAATMGGPKVDRYARSEEDSQVADPDASFAAQENNGLSEGGDALIGDGQNDLIHAQSHLAKAQQLMQACEQGQEDPQHCLIALQKLLEHAGQHLAKLQQNPTRQAEFKQLADQWREIARYMNQLQGQVESNQQNGQQPPPEQQMSEQAMLAMRKDDMENQRKTRKEQSNLALKTQKQNADIALKFRSNALEARLAAAKTGVQIAGAAAKTRAAG